MTDKEIREAIDLLSKLISDKPWDISTLKETEEAIMLAISILKDYLSMEGFPEERKILLPTHPEYDLEQDYIDQVYNQALKDCKLALLKKFSVERIEEILSKFREIEWIMANDSTDTAKRMEKRLTKTALSIHKLLTEVK